MHFEGGTAGIALQCSRSSIEISAGIQYLSQKVDTDDQSRPFGVALLIAGIDEKGPQLYVTSLRSSRGSTVILGWPLS